MKRWRQRATTVSLVRLFRWRDFVSFFSVRLVCFLGMTHGTVLSNLRAGMPWRANYQAPAFVFSIHLSLQIQETGTMMEVDAPVRPFVEQTPQWQRFQTDRIQPSDGVSTTTCVSTQYSHVYHQRLALLGPRIPSRSVDRILELKEKVRSIVVGTLVKEKSVEGDPIVKGTTCRSADVLYLEDESGRVALETDQLHELATGICVGVEGVVSADGVLKVEKFHYPSIAPPPALDAMEESYVMLISGLQCGSSKTSSLPRDMLISYLEGRMGHVAPKISRLVIAGGLVADRSPSALRDLDAFLTQVAAAGLPVDVIPGQNDPTTANWPQRPLHPSLIPRSSRFTTQKRTPNPYACQHGKVKMVGTDGRNIQDLCTQLIDGEKPIEELKALEATLKWGHVCPTGPDSVPTLATTSTTDPMVLKEQPHVFFAGNCGKFGTRLLDGGSRLVCLPQFGNEGKAVLVRLPSLDVQVVQFQEE